MRRFITAIIATIALFTAEAQNSATTIISKSFYGWSHTDRLMIGICDLDADYDVLDTARVVVTYKVSYRILYVILKSLMYKQMGYDGFR